MAKRRKRPNITENQKKNAYTYGNVAYDLNTAPQIVEEEQQPKKKKKPYVNPYRRLREDLKESRKVRIELFFCILFVFVCCIGTMMAFASVEGKKKELDTLQSELALMKSANLELEADITEKLDLGKVAEEATTRLGMAEPQPYQVIHINVPKQSYTVQYDVEPVAPEEKFSLDNIVKFIFGE